MLAFVNPGVRGEDVGRAGDVRGVRRIGYGCQVRKERWLPGENFVFMKLFQVRQL